MQKVRLHPLNEDEKSQNKAWKQKYSLILAGYG